MGVLVSEKSLARTYSHPSVADPYEIVEQYRKAMRFPADTGSTHIAHELEIPRGRIRPWLDGAKPDPVHAIEIATERNWFTDEWNEQTGALSRLIACVYATGSIAEEWYRPSWTPSEQITRKRIQTDLGKIGLGWGLAHKESDHQTTEIRPKNHATVLGRVFVTTGAPIGPKHENVTDLPDYLSESPRRIKREWAQWYVRERGVVLEQKATRVIQLERPRSFYLALAKLIRDVTNETVTLSERGLTISAEAIRALDLA